VALLGAVKIAHTGHSGQLGSAPKDATIPSSSPQRLLIEAAKPRGEICPSNYFSFFLGHARFGFLVKKIFSRRLKIKFIFFLSILTPVSSLKPAGEDGNKADVNKL
jgi:hypothetical protein